ncbi:MAG: lytic transglycosylase domain-containing protein [Parvibaculaceae bacterium]
MTAGNAAKNLLFGMLATGVLLASASWSRADASENDWAVCREAAQRLEAQHGFPEGMVTSIALTESGRRAPDGSHQAWPWTVNAEGRAYYFATRDDAVDAVRRLLAEGKRTIDVGCMQVNLRFHPRAFTSVEEAFDPMSNVAYAAYFLRDLESRSESWEQAIGRYHSYSPALNARYTARVQAIWAREQEATEDRVAAASTEQPAAHTALVAELRLSSFADEVPPLADEISTGSIPRALASIEAP